MKTVKYSYSLRSLYKFLPILTLFTIAAFVYASGIWQYISLDQLRDNQLFLQEYIKEKPLISIAIYSLIYFSIVSLSIPVATILTVIGGFLFGQYISVICIVFSASLGACVIFLSTKFISKNTTGREAKKWVKKMQICFARNAFIYMITLRLVPIPPFVIVNLVAAMLHVPLKTFFLGTFIGIIPSTFIYASVGVSLRHLLNEPNFVLSSLFDPQIIFSLSGLAILVLLPIIYKHLKQKFSYI